MLMIGLTFTYEKFCVGERHHCQNMRIFHLPIHSHGMGTMATRLKIHFRVGGGFFAFASLTLMPSI